MANAPEFQNGGPNPRLGVTQKTSSSYAECSRYKPPFSFVRGQDLTMCDTIWVSSQGHRSVSKSPLSSTGTAVSLFRANTVQ